MSSQDYARSPSTFSQTQSIMSLSRMEKTKDSLKSRMFEKLSLKHQNASEEQLRRIVEEEVDLFYKYQKAFITILEIQKLEQRISQKLNEQPSFTPEYFRRKKGSFQAFQRVVFETEQRNPAIAFVDQNNLQVGNYQEYLHFNRIRRAQMNKTKQDLLDQINHKQNQKSHERLQENSFDNNQSKMSQLGNQEYHSRKFLDEQGALDKRAWEWNRRNLSEVQTINRKERDHWRKAEREEDWEEKREENDLVQSHMMEDFFKSIKNKEIKEQARSQMRKEYQGNLEQNTNRTRNVSMYHFQSSKCQPNPYSQKLLSYLDNVDSGILSSEREKFMNNGYMNHFYKTAFQGGNNESKYKSTEAIKKQQEHEQSYIRCLIKNKDRVVDLVQKPQRNKLVNPEEVYSSQRIREQKGKRWLKQSQEDKYLKMNKNLLEALSKGK